MIAFYGDLLVSIYHDLVSAILPQTEIERDIATMQRRIQHEGMAFLTKTLPALGKSIDVSLSNGTKLQYSGFRKDPKHELPSFLGGLLSVVFRADGVPWFATWYADILHSLQGQEDMELDDKSSRMNDSGVPTLERSDIYCHLIERGIVPHVLPENHVLRRGFPGMRWLYEVGFSRQEIDHISVGHTKVSSPLYSDVELNSRREAMVVALKALRQVCYSFYKLKLPYTHEQEANVLADFCTVDDQLEFNLADLTPEDQIIHREARRIIRRVLANADPYSGIPRHGPGAVATGEKLPEKHQFRRFYKRLSASYRVDEWFFCNLTHVCDSLQELQSFTELEAGTAKVVLVQKDSRGPRLISCEPLEYQWIQQSQMSVLVDTIEHHPLTKGFVNFTNQEVNRRLALQGSTGDYSWVTLDMKEASDRVSLKLVESLFHDGWYDALYASRSPSTRLPDGRIVHMKKFAPMGSAVCFPVEALIFWALSVATLICKHNLPLRKAATKVYVYGDDIICDAAYHGDIRLTLPKFGLMLNASKCCTAGPFKESCGMDAFYGQPVTPTKIRSVWCNHLSPEVLASYVEYSNAFYGSGLVESAFYLERCIEKVLKTHKMPPIPIVSDGEPSCLAYVRRNCNAIYENRKRRVRLFYNNETQRLYARGYRIQSKSKMTKTYGWPFLLRKLTEMEAKAQRTSSVTLDACKLLTGQYPIAHRVQLKRAWTPMT